MLNGSAVTAYVSCTHCSGRDMQNIRLVRDWKGKGKGKTKRKEAPSSRQQWQPWAVKQQGKSTSAWNWMLHIFRFKLNTSVTGPHAHIFRDRFSTNIVDVNQRISKHFLAMACQRAFDCFCFWSFFCYAMRPNINLQMHSAARAWAWGGSPGSHHCWNFFLLPTDSCREVHISLAYAHC